jgi:Phage tail assembly chaperone protein
MMNIDLNLILDPTDNPDILAARLRIIRDRLLAASDWTQLTDAPVDRAAWSTYRQQLRDFPATWTPGSTVTFPTPPNESE